MAYIVILIHPLIITIGVLSLEIMSLSENEDETDYGSENKRSCKYGGGDLVITDYECHYLALDITDQIMICAMY